ncbi:MAG TPA: cytochrome c/FTR1 family iron permease [Candidatus Nitrosocosmicus sp.]|jgi:high-affinity iron transporter|nr:cytochrome c/FTR1 family iron permease [Candidatus Nitrosocosmicus sp.]
MLDPFRLPARGGAIALALSAAIAVLGPAPSIAQSGAQGGAPTTAQAGAPGDADPGPLILHILDYVAADYPGAVKEGKVLDEGEYKEQVEFTTQARALLERLPPRPERAALQALADRLRTLVRDRRPDTEVSTLAAELRGAIIAAYRIEVAPRRAPDLPQAAALFAAHCALCHGATGRGDGPAGKGLDPRPSDFHDADRMARRSLYSLYSTITLGVQGTAMVGFGALSEEERWALAFHVAALGTPEAEWRRGMALWNAGKGRAVFPDLASIATRSARELEAGHGPDAPALLAFLRVQPGAVAAKGNAALATSLRLLHESVDAYRGGRAREAHDLAVSSYLDGFELAEASLDMVDRGLRAQVEAEMLRFRGLVRDGAPLPAVEAQARAVEALLARARAALEVEGLPPGAAFASAFLILLREGLEAILVLAAIIALLVKSGRRDALPWVHGGWIIALLLGGLTWWIASYVVRISGATREMTEGVTALVAAAVLLYVGFWMHSKSQASRWQTFLETRLAGAMSGRALRALGLVSFLAVYREVFETVLFYEALAAQAGPRSTMALLGGLVAAAATLLVLGWAIVRGSLRMPLALFFGVSAMLIGLLAVVFAGKGIAALQEAGYLPVHPVNIPPVPLVGLYSSAEGLIVQAVLLVGVAVGFAWTSRAARSERAL